MKEMHRLTDMLRDDGRDRFFFYLELPKRFPVHTVHHNHVQATDDAPTKVDLGSESSASENTMCLFVITGSKLDNNIVFGAVQGSNVHSGDLVVSEAHENRSGLTSSGQELFVGENR